MSADPWSMRIGGTPAPESAPPVEIPVEEAESGYRAVKHGRPGEYTSFQVVPADPAAASHFVSYFQPMAMQLNTAYGLLSFGTAQPKLAIHLEGDGIAEIANQINQRRVVALYEFSPGRYGKLPADTELVIRRMWIEPMGEDGGLRHPHGPSTLQS
ncbi:hypothetical protein [Parvularcula marina]|uniref:hypothetical protein n=1 Tax=Parvularcula marina TaxID=2292771 RepID=UPI003513FD32